MTTDLPNRGDSSEAGAKGAGSGSRSAARGRSGKNSSAPVYSGARVRLTRLGRKGSEWLDRPMASLHLLIAVFLLLLGVGLMMVLASSSVTAFRTSNRLTKGEAASSFGVFKSQLMFAGIGLIVFFILMKFSLDWLKKLSFPSVLVSIVLLGAVLVIGQKINGARSWLQLGPLSFQPSEVAKFALVIWGGYLLASRRAVLGSLRQMMFPLLPYALGISVLIMLQPDLGTTASLMVIVLALLFFAGASWWLFIVVGIGGVGGLIVYALNSPIRLARITSFLYPEKDPTGQGLQLTQSLFGLSDGGIFGVGLGQSRAKWSYLPNADSDFIFSIIGEELGLIGAIAVIVLYLILLWVGLRIARRNVDPFVKLVASTSTVWLVGQAMINIFYVIGLLPVTGLTLPMISTGGTSLIITMAIFGLLANFARREPQAVAAARAKGPSRIAQFFGVGAMTVSTKPIRAAKRTVKKNNQEWARTAAKKAREEKLAGRQATLEAQKAQKAQKARSQKSGSQDRPRRLTRAELRAQKQEMAARRARPAPERSRAARGSTTASGSTPRVAPRTGDGAARTSRAEGPGRPARQQRPVERRPRPVERQARTVRRSESSTGRPGNDPGRNPTGRTGRARPNTPGNVEHPDVERPNGRDRPTRRPGRP
ncbi:putative lipid II flippase FtsW [Nakamurella silvestris]|nr:putative lipid II flippase FtsW [Nakamurella silvestris]